MNFPFLLIVSLKKAEKCQNMYEVYHTLYIIVTNYSVRIFMFVCIW